MALAPAISHRTGDLSVEWGLRYPTRGQLPLIRLPFRVPQAQPGFVSLKDDYILTSES